MSKIKIYHGEDKEKFIREMLKNPKKFIGKFIDLKDHTGKSVIRGYIREIGKDGLKLEPPGEYDVIVNPKNEKNN
jgi:hypothetical protein